jgi:hypothetical protein
MVGRALMMPGAGLSFADVSLAAMDCDSNRTRTAKRLGVSVRALDAAIDREGLHSWFAQTKGIFNRNIHRRFRPRCVTRQDVQNLIDEGYLREDAASILGISTSYLRDLCVVFGVSFAGDRSMRIKIGKGGYCG